ncbi:MAG: SPOR domain-containing protein [Limnobacter sp.]|nr:SPOR domain-containing protein [Limnobacter sp.]
MSSKSKPQSNSRNSNDQADELKRRARRRLVGSIVLFLTAIIVVPAVIETEPAQTQSPIELVVPEKPDADEVQSPEPTTDVSEGGSIFEQENVVQSPKPADDSVSKTTDSPAQGSSAKNEPDPVARAVKDTSPPPASKPEPETKAQPTERPEPDSETRASTAVSSDPIEKFAQADVYWVQVVAVSNKNRADALRDELSSKGFEGRIESISTDQGTVYRVRVGPLAGSASANDVKQRLKAAGYEGRIVQ